MRMFRVVLPFVLLVCVAPAAAQQPPPPVLVPSGRPGGPPPPAVVPGRVAPVEGRPRPVIERIEPASGPAGTAVVVVGRNFAAGDRVTLAGRELDIREIVPTRITVVVPPGAASGRLVVIGAAGTAESAQVFTIIQPPPPPQIAGFAPAAGPPGTDVVIHGGGFSMRIFENSVSLAGLVIPVRTASPTHLTVTIPEGASSGPFVVTVASAGQAQSAVAFQVQAHLRIERLDPAEAPVGASVRLIGSGFNPTVDGNTVRLGDRRCAVRSASPTELTVEVPARAQSGSFVAAVAGRGEVVSPPFRAVYPPVVKSFSPREGFAGTEVTVRGENLGETLAGTQVALSGVAAQVLSVTPAELRFAVPDGASSGAVQVTVAGSGTAGTAEPFTVWIPPAVSGFHPTRGAPGTRVTVAGRGFLGDRSKIDVTIGDRRAEVVSATETEVVAEVPAGAVTGRIVVSIRGRGEARSAGEFAVLARPQVRQVSPNGVPPGGEVTLIGENFGSSASDVTVAFGGVQCVVRAFSSTEIVVVVPVGVERGRFVVTIRGIGEARSPTYRVGRPSSWPGPPPPVLAPSAPPPHSSHPPGPPPPAIVR